MELAYFSDHVVGFLLEADFGPQTDKFPEDWKRRFRNERVLSKKTAINLLNFYISYNNLAEISLADLNAYQGPVKMTNLLLRWFGPGTTKSYVQEGITIREWSRTSFLPFVKAIRCDLLRVIFTFLAKDGFTEEQQIHLKDSKVGEYHRLLEDLSTPELHRVYFYVGQDYEGDVVSTRPPSPLREVSRESRDLPEIPWRGLDARTEMLAVWEARNGRIL
jgi:hypothetical protein